jgi:DNA-binding NarL/FixJ family response regulator
MKKTRILIADDHSIVRRGVAALLESEPDLEVCGEASSGREAIEAADRLKPDLVIIDIGMPEMNGLDATRHIAKDHPEIEVLILTMHDSEELVHGVLDAGARGYVLKSDVTESLLSAVRALLRHEIFMTCKVAEYVVQGFLGSSSDRQGMRGQASHTLSPREREVVQLLAEGKSNKEVAALLSISLKTVETHRANVMSKLDLHSMSDLVRYAIRNHIIES